MFKEKVNALTDARTDNGPWHKLAGLWPVELKTISCEVIKVEIVWKRVKDMKIL